MADAAAEEDSSLQNEEPCVNFMIVTALDVQYAVRSDLVQEIMSGAKVHSLPLVPPYIEGVLNCRGEAWTVLNPLCLFEDREKKPKEAHYLLFKYPSDRFCLHISTAETFFPVPETELEATPDKILYKKKKLRIINPDTIEEKLQSDLEK